MIPERLLGGDLKKPCDIWDYYAQMDEEQRRLIDEELWPRVTTFYLHVDQPLKPFLESRSLYAWDAYSRSQME